MDRITLNAIQGAAGAAGDDKVYVDDVFSTYAYEGTGSSLQINNGIDLDGEGGMVWLKYRNAAEPGQILDTVRGKTKDLRPDSSAAEGTNTDRISAWNADGFTLSTNSVVNTNGGKHVSWSFRKAPGFFDVVTYTGNGTAGRTVSHNLGCVPGMIIIKCTSGAAGGGWVVYHKSLGNANTLWLSGTYASTPYAYWNSTSPTATEFTLNGDPDINGATAPFNEYVAYLFADGDDAAAQIFGDGGDESIIKCGTYGGSGLVGAPEINLGWEPQWVMVKRSVGGTGLWLMADNMRGITTGGDDPYLQANGTDAEVDYAWIDFTPTGFKLMDSGVSLNAYASDYIYIAIRRGPMKTPEDATKVFNAVKTSSQPISIGFTPDLAIVTATTNASANYFVPRLTIADMNSATNGAESTSGSYFKFDLQNNFSTGTFFSGWETINWMFKRAPGFFDVVCYDGTSNAQTVTHNLGVVPEMIITKNRDSTESWAVYHSGMGATKGAILDTDALPNTYTPYWNDTAPTSTQFTVGTFHGVNKSGDDFIAYLFASCPGVSKVGTYDGSLDPINIDCGFSGGARFVLIKATTRNGEWHVWDSARGITTGISPYLKIDLTNAQSLTDYLDPYTGGFSVVGAGTNDGAINAVGESYIYLAIA